MAKTLTKSESEKRLVYTNGDNEEQIIIDKIDRFNKSNSTKITLNLSGDRKILNFDTEIARDIAYALIKECF